MSTNWLQRIPPEQMTRVLDAGSGDIDDTFLGFTDVYEHLAAIIPKHWTIVDLGCAYAPQAWIFADHARYVGVNLDEIVHFEAPNSHFHICSIERFIAEHAHEFDLNTTFAICSYVPPWGGDNMEMTRRAFKNCFVYYPASPDSIRVKPKI